MKKVGKIGGAGYMGGEAVILPVNHTDEKLAFVDATGLRLHFVSA